MSVMRFVTGGIVSFIVAVLQPVLADENTKNVLKTHGVGLELYSQNQDLKLTGLTLDNPLLTTLLPANLQDQVKINNEIKLAGAKLDYWVNPNLNVFGGVAQAQGKAVATLPRIMGVTLPDVKLDANGMMYNVGATVVGYKDPYFATLTYVHSIADFNGSKDAGAADTVIPGVGVVTGAGAFSLGLIHQQGKVNYTGSLDLPLVGTVSAEVESESKHRINYTAGYHAQLGKDLFLSANAGFGNWREARLEINKRF